MEGNVKGGSDTSQTGRKLIPATSICGFAVLQFETISSAIRGTRNHIGNKPAAGVPTVRGIK